MTRFLLSLFALANLTCFAEDNATVNLKSPKSKAVVGAYYYPWYETPRPGAEPRDWKRAMRLHLQPPQFPKAGLYESSKPDLIGEHIRQSIRGGIDFWAVSWWGRGSESDGNFRNAILKHPSADKLRYAVLYETARLLRSRSSRKPAYDNLTNDLAYLREHYFNDPNYLRIDDRPVIFVYLSRVYFRNQGHDSLAQMRKLFPEVYLVGDDVFGADYKPEWAKPFDAITIYDVYGQSLQRDGGTRKAVESLAENYRVAKQAANQVGTAFIPTVAPGYNDTAVRGGHPGRGRYFTDVEDSKEGDIFRAMIKNAALPNLDPKAGNLLMVTSFNEWYEDTQIEATTGTAPDTTQDDSSSGTHYTGGDRYVDYGYLYLDILRAQTSDEE
jgi:glycoprotein endo-alpha-1,2-mannosidase